LDAHDERKDRFEPPETPEPEFPVSPPRVGSRLATSFITFLILLSVWILLSGKLDLFHLSLGVISCTIVTLFSGDLLFPEPRVKGLLSVWARFVGYLPWLLYQVFLANLHILYLVFHPRMMDLIDPRISRFQSRLKGELSLTTLANSITLTPGTITVFVSIDGDFRVHAIDTKSAEMLPGEMELRVARVFGEA
jgi:multicomponent Na+:H+ antiporter subunit E